MLVTCESKVLTLVVSFWEGEDWEIDTKLFCLLPSSIEMPSCYFEAVDVGAVRRANRVALH
jgi:hypothetical protein